MSNAFHAIEGLEENFCTLQRWKSNINDPKRPVQARIVGVQFGVLSPNEILRLSAVEVVDTSLNKSGVVNKTGVNDPRLGTARKSMLCSTCVQPLSGCPGHTGHISLVLPVINIEFISSVLKVLSCVCFYCSKLLVPLDNPKYHKITSVKNKKKRMALLYTACQSIRSCSYTQVNSNSSCKDSMAHGHCGGLQPVYSRSDIFIFTDFNPKDCTSCKLTPVKLVQILSHISDADATILGFDPKNAHPSSMIWQTFLIPSISIRLSRAKVNSTRVSGEDDLTFRLRTIIRLNSQLKQVMQDPEEVIFSRSLIVDTGPRKVSCGKLYLYNELARSIASYQDSKIQCGYTGSDRGDYGSERKCIRDRFTGKAKRARMRYTVFGKRQNYSARSVVTPWLHMKADEVGVPKWICMRLTFPERVCQWNIHRLISAVRNGPYKHPGANFVVDKEGKNVCLKSVDRYLTKLEFGFIVHRHLIDGDFVLFNRQPSLHRMSLMCHRVKVFTTGNTFRLHVSVTASYNADFDGDEMNLQVVMDEYTRAEASVLMSVQNNMVKDGRPIVRFEQHAVIGAYLMSLPRLTFTRQQAWQLLCMHPCIDAEALFTLNARKSITGADIISLFFPITLNLCEGGVEIRNGRIISGRLNKTNLNDVILFAIWRQFGPEVALELISNLQPVLERYIESHGLTIGWDDCFIPIPSHIQEKIEKARVHIDSFTDHQPKHLLDKVANDLEDKLVDLAGKMRDYVGNFVLEESEKRKNRNGLLAIVQSGAKGNLTNIVQIAGLVGQQVNHMCMRMTASEAHAPQHSRAISHGLICRSFTSGLLPLEYFNHLIGTRVGLVDTAVKTSETGYSQRKLSKGLEDLVTRADLAVCNSDGGLVQYMYGGDGYDPCFLETIKLDLISMEDSVIIQNFRCVPGIYTSQMNAPAQLRWKTQRSTEYPSQWRIEVLRLLKLKRDILNSLRGRQYFDTCTSPLKFSRIALCAAAVGDEEMDVTPCDVHKVINQLWLRLVRENLIIPAPKIELLYRTSFSTSTLWGKLHVDAVGLEYIINRVLRELNSAKTKPHSTVGIIASQHCSEPLTQLTLNRFHKSGQVTELVNGITRMKEIINVSAPSNPRMSLVPQKAGTALAIGRSLVQRFIKDIVSQSSFSVRSSKRFCEFKKIWKRKGFLISWPPRENDHLLTIHLCKKLASDNNITPRDVATAIIFYPWVAKNFRDIATRTFYSRSSEPKWWVSIVISESDASWSTTSTSLAKYLTSSPSTHLILYQIYDRLLNVLVKGIPGIEDFFIGKREITTIINGLPSVGMVDVVNTKGSNFIEALKRKDIKTWSIQVNNVREVEQALGIDAVCSFIESEWGSVMRSNGASVALRHIRLIAQTMCYRGILCPMSYSGICRENTSVAKKVSFEKAMESFIQGASQGQKDIVKGCMDSICWNGIVQAGTGMVKVELEPTEVPKAIQLKNEHTYLVRTLVSSPYDKNYLIEFQRDKVSNINVKFKKSVVAPSSYPEFFVTPNPTVIFRPSSPGVIIRDCEEYTITPLNGTFCPSSPEFIK